MLPHSTVAGIYFVVAAAAAAYMFPAAVGIVVVRAEEPAPFGMHCLPAVVAAFVAAIVDGAAFVAAIVAGAVTAVAIAGLVEPGTVVDTDARCIVHSADVRSTPPIYPTRSGLSPCSLS